MHQLKTIVKSYNMVLAMPISTIWLRLMIYLIEFSICEGWMSWSGACYMSAGLVKRGRKPILIGPMLISVTQMLARIIFHEESICKKREKKIKDEIGTIRINSLQVQIIFSCLLASLPAAAQSSRATQAGLTLLHGLRKKMSWNKIGLKKFELRKK